MTARAQRQPAPAPVSAITEFAQQADGTRLRVFTLDGIRVQVQTLDGASDTAAAELVAKLHAICSIPPGPARIGAWGPGQHDRTRLGPGVEASIRVTREGRTRLVIPGGDLDVTEGDCRLGLGLLEASRIAGGDPDAARGPGAAAEAQRTGPRPSATAEAMIRARISAALTAKRAGREVVGERDPERVGR
jgi:hypothetical protein